MEQILKLRGVSRAPNTRYLVYFGSAVDFQFLKRRNYEALLDFCVLHNTTRIIVHLTQTDSSYMITARWSTLNEW